MLLCALVVTQVVEAREQLGTGRYGAVFPLSVVSILMLEGWSRLERGLHRR